ncbi:MAG TPA: antitoxin [Pseudonocardiaceae bacterium]|jgi:Arc/MetJ-type ribon-helix-helix transcriptional regulator|nr:antitoxin [Pseudonocardiaceae bacterium]
MKVSISLSEQDVEFLDDYASSHDVPSRSATVQRAVALLREHALSDSYERAWADWTASPDASLWEATAADGLDG